MEGQEKELVFEYTLNDMKDIAFLAVKNALENNQTSKEEVYKFVDNELEDGKKEYEEIMKNLGGIDKLLENDEMNHEILDGMQDYIKKIQEKINEE